MADGVFNIAKGAVVEKVRDDATNLGVLLLESAEADDTLDNYDDLDALLSAAGNIEAAFTNYARKTGISGTIAVDDAGNLVDVDMPDQTWVDAGNGTNETLAKLIIFYDEGGTEATRIPLTHHDFSPTTDSSDLTAEYDPNGFYRAS